MTTIEFEVEELQKLYIEGKFTVNGWSLNRLTLAGLKAAIKRGETYLR